ncbi:uncharacterized protein MYCGRDRAFT_11476, partial [Zymoseptoria tritici IPO323]
QDLRKFLHWHLNHSEITKLGTLYVFARQFRQAYKIQTGQVLDTKLISEMRHNTLRTEFDLQEDRSDKPVLNVDDLLATLHVHWVRCQEWYAAERQRVQLSLILLLIVYTSARPSAVFTSFETAGDCLKYKDIQIFKVKGQSQDDHVLLMIVTLRLMKGQRNKSLAPKYVFHERDDNLAFCPILHVLALAFADKAFSSPWLQEPKDIYTFHVDGDRGLQGLPLEWKRDMLDMPVLRRSTDSRAALKYHEARDANVRLGKAVGYKDPFQFYQGRRGAGEALNARTTVAVRNRAMGHSRAEIYDKYYTNQTVAADTQSAFLGTPSQDWMVSLASHLGLTRDPSAQKLVPDPTSQEVDSQREVSQLIQQTQELRLQIVQRYGSLKRALQTPILDAYKSSQAQLRGARLRASKELKKQRWKEHFDTIGKTEIARQRTGQPLPSSQNPEVQYEFEERALLSELLCRNDDVSKLETGDVVHRRLQALTAMVALCHRRQGPRQRRRRSASPVPSEPYADTINLDCLQGNQCPWCLHDETLSKGKRQFAYSQISKLRDHIQKKHFP